MNNRQIALLAELFCQQFPDIFHNSRMDKFKTLFNLAANVPSWGVILELGTFHGGGTISLAWGALEGGSQSAIHTCDVFKDNRGWVGEEYKQADEHVFTANLIRAGVMVTLHKMRAEDLFPKWDTPISLLFWDIGDVPKGRLANDFECWSRHIARDGMFVMHEPGNYAFGGDKVIQKALANGWGNLQTYPGYIWSITKE